MTNGIMKSVLGLKAQIEHDSEEIDENDRRTLWYLFSSWAEFWKRDHDEDDFGDDMDEAYSSVEGVCQEFESALG